MSQVDIITGFDRRGGVILTGDAEFAGRGPAIDLHFSIRENNFMIICDYHGRFVESPGPSNGIGTTIDIGPSTTLLHAPGPGRTRLLGTGEDGRIHIRFLSLRSGVSVRENRFPNGENREQVLVRSRDWSLPLILQTVEPYQHGPQLGPLILNHAFVNRLAVYGDTGGRDDANVGFSVYFNLSYEYEPLGDEDPSDLRIAQPFAGLDLGQIEKRA
ncbi:MAG: hypothetical protein AMXMBFR13_04120 [Phycisphaerae bacterium]